MNSYEFIWIPSFKISPLFSDVRSSVLSGPFFSAPAAPPGPSSQQSSNALRPATPTPGPTATSNNCSDKTNMFIAVVEAIFFMYIYNYLAFWRFLGINLSHLEPSGNPTWGMFDGCCSKNWWCARKIFGCSWQCISTNEHSNKLALWRRSNTWKHLGKHNDLIWQSNPISNKPKSLVKTKSQGFLAPFWLGANRFGKRRLFVFRWHPANCRLI